MTMKVAVRLDPFDGVEREIVVPDMEAGAMSRTGEIVAVARNGPQTVIHSFSKGDVLPSGWTLFRVVRTGEPYEAPDDEPSTDVGRSSGETTLEAIADDRIAAALERIATSLERMAERGAVPDRVVNPGMHRVGELDWKRYPMRRQVGEVMMSGPEAGP